MNKLRFLSQNFLVRKRWVHKTASSTRIHVSCKQSIKHKTSYSKLKNAVLNPSKSFLTLKKKSALGFYQLLKDRSLKKWEKHRAHTLSTR